MAMTRTMRLRAVVTGSAIGMASLLGLASPANAHFTGYDSVDGCEIRDEDETSFDAERIYARDRWEALKKRLPLPLNFGYCVDIAADTWSTIADLEWKTANNSSVTWAGLYENEVGADDIHLNAFYMNKYTTCQRQFVALHELGHAHGLAHSFSGQIMNRFVQNTCTLQYHDIADYHTLWG